MREKKHSVKSGCTGTFKIDIYGRVSGYVGLSQVLKMTEMISFYNTFLTNSCKITILDFGIDN
jgi:predicted nucleotide-binding protein (sugar kinase/HSP70/actin superfamily)